MFDVPLQPDLVSRSMRPTLTLEQLRIFVAAAEREHMTRAAGALLDLIQEAQP